MKISENNKRNIIIGANIAGRIVLPCVAVLGVVSLGFSLTKEGLPFVRDNAKRTGYTITTTTAEGKTKRAEYLESCSNYGDSKSIVVVYDKILDVNNGYNAIEYNLDYLSNEDYQELVNMISNNNEGLLIAYLSTSVSRFKIKLVNYNYSDVKSLEPYIVSKTVTKNGTYVMECESKENSKFITRCVLFTSLLFASCIETVIFSDAEENYKGKKYKNKNPNYWL